MLSQSRCNLLQVSISLEYDVGPPVRRRPWTSLDTFDKVHRPTLRPRCGFTFIYIFIFCSTWISFSCAAPPAPTILVSGFIGLYSTLKQSYTPLCIQPIHIFRPLFIRVFTCIHSPVIIVGYALCINNSCSRLHRPIISLFIYKFIYILFHYIYCWLRLFHNSFCCWLYSRVRKHCTTLYSPYHSENTHI